MSISINEVRHVARLARLELDEAEILALQGELNRLLGHFADIADVAISEDSALAKEVLTSNVWSDDLPQPGMPRADALRNAPVSRAGLFVVPTIIEG